jgi:hypothetical protein
MLEHKKVIDELNEDYREQLEDEQTTRENILADKESMKQAHADVRRILEDDAEKEIDLLKEKNLNEYTFISEASLKSQGELHIMNTTYTNQLDQITKLQNSKKSLLETFKNQ